jgi:hypothetical protein
MVLVSENLTQFLIYIVKHEIEWIQSIFKKKLYVWLFVIFILLLKKGVENNVPFAYIVIKRFDEILFSSKSLFLFRIAGSAICKFEVW